MRFYRRAAFAPLAFSSALLGVTLPVVFGGSSGCTINESSPTETIASGSNGSESTPTGTPNGGIGGSSLQFMDGLSGSGGGGGEGASGPVEGPLGKVTYAFDAAYGGSGANDVVNAFDVAVDSAGSVIVVGSFKGQIDFDGPGGMAAKSAVGAFDLFVAKYDDKGSLKWVKTAGDGVDQVARAVAVDKDGRVGFCGSFRGGFSIDNKTLQVTDSQFPDAYAVVLNANGDLISSQRFDDGVGQTSACSAAAFDSSGNLVLAGQFQSDLKIGTSTLKTQDGGDYAIFLAKLTANAGTKDFSSVFAKSFGSAGVKSDALAVAVSSNGDIALAGTTEGDISFGGANLSPKESPMQQAVVARFDANGNYKFGRVLESGDESRATAVRFHSNGDLFVGGAFRKSIDLGSGSISAVGGADDVFVARFDENNKLVFGVRFGDGGSDELLDLAIDTNGQAVFVGSFQGNVVVNSKTTLKSNGIRDGMVVKLAADGSYGYWGYGFGDSAEQVARGVALAPNGNSVFVANFKGKVDFSDIGGSMREAPNSSQSFVIGNFLP